VSWELEKFKDKFIMIFWNKLITGFLLAGCFYSGLTANLPQKKPNVIIIYTDDQGAVDLNSFGAKDLVTPNMDKIVKSGIKFTQFMVHLFAPHQEQGC